VSLSRRATVLTFALGHEQLPPSYTAARHAGAATSLDDLVDQVLAVTAPK